MMVESFQIKMDFGLNIFYFKVTMIIQTNMIYTQKIGLERKHHRYLGSVEFACNW